jgi:hypothetical protein
MLTHSREGQKFFWSSTVHKPIRDGWGVIATQASVRMVLP